MTNRLAIILLLLCRTAFAGAELPDLGDSSEPRLGDRHEIKKQWQYRRLVHDAPQRIRDPLVHSYIQHLGQRLVAANPQQHANFEFYVFASPSINAFAGPAHIVVVNSELIRKTANESELAAVIAHELAHVQQRHLQRMVEHTKNMRIPMALGAIAAVAVGAAVPSVGSGALVAGMAGLQQDMINFTREHEQEADRIGLHTLYAANFDPTSMAKFFERLQEQERYYAFANRPGILRTHPVNSERIADALNRAKRLPPLPIKHSADYAFIKARVEVIASGNAETTYQHYLQKHQAQPNNEALTYGYALTLLIQERVAPAVELLEKLYAAHPESLLLGTTYADALDQQRDYKAAEAVLAPLYSIYPSSDAVILQYADALLANNKPETAIDLLHRAHFDAQSNELIMTKLAQTEAQYGSKAMAYFIAGKQALRQGKATVARKRLLQAQKLAHKQNVLQAKIKALLAQLK